MLSAVCLFLFFSVVVVWGVNDDGVIGGVNTFSGGCDGEVEPLVEIVVTQLWAS